MPESYSNRNFQKASFKNAKLTKINFSGSDLRGADFSGADLTGADLSNVRTGIALANVFLLFIAALLVSLLSGYVAMLAGRTMQLMLDSPDIKIRNGGIITIAIVIVAIIYLYWKGGGKVLWNLLVPVIITAFIIGIISYMSGFGTGKGMLYLILALVLAVIMFSVGTMARAAAGSLSNILFVVVALSGGMFGKTVGGGIGTIVMALACALISKRALSGVKGFETLRYIASYITRKFGTSFRRAKLNGASFSQATLKNADFSNADDASVNWEGAKKNNCINREGDFTSK
jgi:uncharacterized protein YjbI with pentapeptide repeats